MSRFDKLVNLKKKENIVINKEPKQIIFDDKKYFYDYLLDSQNEYFIRQKKRTTNKK